MQQEGRLRPPLFLIQVNAAFGSAPAKLQPVSYF